MIPKKAGNRAGRRPIGELVLVALLVGLSLPALAGLVLFYLIRTGVLDMTVHVIRA
jgi:hypothetical protein